MIVENRGIFLAMTNKSRHYYCFSTVANKSKFMGKSWSRFQADSALLPLFALSLQLDAVKYESDARCVSKRIDWSPCNPCFHHWYSCLNSTHCTTLGLHSLLNVVQLLDLVTKKICHIHGSQSVWMWVNCIHRSTRRVHQNTSTVRLDWADLYNWENLCHFCHTFYEFAP